VTFFPQALGDRQCVYVEIMPPSNFIASLMQLTVMAAAERHPELIAKYAPSGVHDEHIVMKMARLI